MVLPVLVAAALLSRSGAFAQTPQPYQDVLTYLGRTGDYRDGVLKIGLPRNDLRVSVMGTGVPTPFGFGGWLAMTRGAGGHDVMMGDLVLLQDEVNPVMSALLDNGLDVTALHNHFFWEQPRIFHMHVHGHGSGVDIAHRVKPALDLIGHVAAAGAADPPGTPAALPQGNLDTKALAGIVGQPGEQLGPVYKFTIGRKDLTVRDMGAVINSRMGLNSWAAFVGTDSEAMVAGDIAMLDSEVTPVLRTLRANGLNVVAIHQHMTGTRPLIMFLHYLGRGPAADLARGFRAAMNELGQHHNSGMSH